jgi:nucleoside-diphosphate-sugar epimerase
MDGGVEGPMLSGKRVFITGGAGFIGSSLAVKLADQNQVILYDNLHHNALYSTNLANCDNVEIFEGDVLDAATLGKAMAGAQVVVHCAAIAGVDTVLESPVRTMRVNLLGTINALEAAQKLTRLERFIDFSTSEVFGTHAYKVEETHITTQGSVGEARWTYAVSKLAGEYLSHSYYHEFGVPAVTVRPFNIYGPNQVGVGAIHHFIRRALANQDVEIHGDGSQIRAWCYISDIIDALLLILENPAAVGQVFNIGNPRSTVTIFDLAKSIIRIADSGSKMVFRPINYVDVEIRVPSIDKARTLLRFDPRVDLEDGLRSTIEWYRRHV